MTFLFKCQVIMFYIFTLQFLRHENIECIMPTVERYVIFNETFELYYFQLEDHGSLTAEELAQSLGISVLLAKERLLTAEKHGKACRDESIEGLRFYPNQFLQRGD